MLTTDIENSGAGKHRASLSVLNSAVIALCFNDL